MTSPESDRRPDDLIQAYLDGSLAPSEAEELLDALRTRPRVVERLFEALRTDTLIRHTVRAMEQEALAGDTGAAPLQVDLSALNHHEAPGPADRSESVHENDVRRIKEYAEYQLELFLAEQQRQRNLGYRLTQPHRPGMDMVRVATKVDRLMAAAAKAVVGAAVCAVLAMAVVIAVQYMLSHRVIATLGSSSNAKWSIELQTKELRPGRMSLEQGLAQLVFRSGAEVLIQAPSTFRLQSSSRLFLESGRLTARVPRQARGFTVITSEAEVVDFGTEFGVMVAAKKSSEVHVFDGRITLASAGLAGSTAPQGLKGGDTATVDGAGHIAMGSLADRPPLFIRKIPGNPAFAIPGKRLSLADMVGGGNGLDTGVLGQGINPLTGHTGPTRWVVEAQGNGFVRTPDLPFVDGVFVPGSGKGPMVVTSGGIVSQIATEGSGFCYQGIANSATFQHMQFDVHPGRLASVAYGTPEHPSLGMHANAGITFDLEKIRATMPEVEICRFQALCGVSETVADYSDGTWDSNNIRVHFWVLVDGQVRFSKELAAVPSTPQRIDLPLGPADHFLSLMTTAADRRTVLCWGMFAEPSLELGRKTRTTAD